MSVIHGINIFLNEEFNQKNISIILKEGVELGLIYFKDFPVQANYSAYETFNIDELVDIIANIKVYDENSLFNTKFKDTGFMFSIYKTEDFKLKISFGGFYYVWKKLFCNSDADYAQFDLSRYTFLMLELCKNFTIIRLEKWSI